MPAGRRYRRGRAYESQRRWDKAEQTYRAILASEEPDPHALFRLGRVLERGPGQDDAAYQLKVIGRSLIQAFERYYITLAALAKNGPHVLTAGELENACTLTAQRLSLLSEQAAPEFFDKALFRGFIQKLRERKIVWTDEAGKLDYDSALDDMVRDARVILAREVRHSILKITPGGNDDRHEVERDDDKAVSVTTAGEATPPDASPADLHARHVEAAHRVHVHEPVEPVAPAEPDTSRDERRSD